MCIRDSCNAGVVCYAMGRYEQAEKYFRQAYELFPRYNFCWRHPIVEAYLDSYEGSYPVISSACPAVLRLIQTKYPERCV